VFLVRSPVAYHPAGSRRGTATLKFYEGRDNLLEAAYYRQNPSLAEAG
jgi:hypothetical protein